MSDDADAMGAVLDTSGAVASVPFSRRR